LPTDAATQDVAIFWLVVAGRFLLPLFIPRFPLPAILVCLALDGIDQTIYQQFTDLDLTGYQGYDKALDIYYLTIAYLATLRNWTNGFAFEVSRFLLYYRLGRSRRVGGAAGAEVGQEAAQRRAAHQTAI
jgi:hypothetical protein